MVHAWCTQATWAKKRERLNDGINNGQLRIANATSGGARKAAWANVREFNSETLGFSDVCTNATCTKTQLSAYCGRSINIHNAMIVTFIEYFE